LDLELVTVLAGGAGSLAVVVGDVEIAPWRAEASVALAGDGERGHLGERGDAGRIGCLGADAVNTGRRLLPDETERLRVHFRQRRIAIVKLQFGDSAVWRQPGREDRHLRR